jgi:uncharacterized protein
METPGVLPGYVAFNGTSRIASGDLTEVAAAVKACVDAGDDPRRPVLVFDAATSEPVELDLRGSVEDVLARLAAPPAVAAPRAPGRPRLGVVAREVTLLPRHWEWLAAQPGGASVTLRKLVERARRGGSGAERRRLAQDASYRFMNVMAGNEPGFEEALRALYAGDAERFATHIELWPADVAAHARTLADAAFLSRDP